jgi:hypothetical protein
MLIFLFLVISKGERVGERDRTGELERESGREGERERGRGREGESEIFIYIRLTLQYTALQHGRH